MTSTEAHTDRRRPGESPAWRRALWSGASQLLVVVAIIWSFGAIARIHTPNLPRVVLMIALASVALVLCPRDRLARIRPNVLLFLLSAWAALSLLWTPEFDGALRHLATQVVPLLAVWAVASTLRPEEIRRTMVITSVAITTVSLVLVAGSADARAGTIMLYGVEQPQLGWRGGFRHKNHLGTFSVYAVLIALSLVRRRALMVLAAVAPAVLILGARSLTAVFGLLGGLIVLVLLHRRHQLLTAAQRLGMPRSAGVLIVLLVVLGGLGAALMSVYGKDATLSERTTIWRETMTTAMERPILGHGLAAAWYTQDEPLTVDLEQRIQFRAFHAHNGFIDLFLVLGAVGVVMVAALILRVVVLAGGNLRAGRRSDEAIWVLSSVGALAALTSAEQLLRPQELVLITLWWCVVIGVRIDEPAGPAAVGANA